MYVIYLLALLVALILSFATKRQPLRKIARISVVLMVLLFVIPMIIGALIFGGVFDKEPPTLTALQKSFPKQRPDLEAIVRMSDEDSTFARIAPTFSDRFVDPPVAGLVSEQTDKLNSLPETRWNQYRAIYSRSNIKMGIQRNQVGDIFIIANSIGLLNRGHATGYLYCRTVEESDVNRFEPCESNQSSGSHKYDPESRAEGYSFQKLADHWYAYDQGPS